MSEPNEDTTFQLLGLPKVVDEHGLRSREPFEVLASQYVDELRKGLRPSIELYARRFPPHADRIREFFPLLTMLEQARIENEASLFRQNMPEKFPFTHLAGCELLCELGRGGMGVVFQGKDQKTGHIVAIKMLPWRTSIVPEWMHKFQREARIASQIRNAHIVAVFHCGEENGYIFYTMQFVNGVGLDRIITRLQHTSEVIFNDELTLLQKSRPKGFVSPPHNQTLDHENADGTNHSGSHHEAARKQLSRHSWVGFARIAVQTAMALKSAHASGIIHNDIKPGNLLVDANGHVWVTDFGLSQPFDPVSIAPMTLVDSLTTLPGDNTDRKATSTRTVSGLYGMRHRHSEKKPDDDSCQRLAGTLRYMAPERLMGFVPNVRSDIYSLGMTLYELSLQVPAFQLSSREKLLDAILDETPPAARSVKKEFPKDLETIIQNCIARSPDDRYPSAEALLADLLKFCSGSHISPVRPAFVSGLFRSFQKRITGGSSESS